MRDKPKRRFASKLPPWQLARTCMVFLLGLGLVTNIFAHYVFRITWHRCDYYESCYEVGLGDEKGRQIVGGICMLR